LQFSALEGRVIKGLSFQNPNLLGAEMSAKATQYWTAANIADGLNALTICIEVSHYLLNTMWEPRVDLSCDRWFSSQY
jgi:hypothetical protein